jgi:hypothetical protein
MRVEKFVHSANSKRESNTIEGKINNQNAYFSLYDDEQYAFLSYLKEDIKINYDNLKPLKLDVRVAQFGTSNNVTFIKQNETKEEAVKNSILPFIIIELIAISITTLLHLLHKKNNRVRRLNS